MTFHHHMKILSMTFIATIAINQTMSMDHIEKNSGVEDIGSVRIDIPSLEESTLPVRTDLIDSAITVNPVSQILPQDNSLNQQDDINLNEEVPGCADNYFRCCILHWRIAKGWYSFGSLLTGSFGAGILIPAILDIAPEYRKALEISALVLGSTATLLQAIKVFGIQQIQEHQADLREMLVESHAGTRTVYRPKAVRKIRD